MVVVVVMMGFSSIFSFFPSTVYSKMKNEQRSKTQAKEMKLFSRYTRPITFVILILFGGTNTASMVLTKSQQFCPTVNIV